MKPGHDEHYCHNCSTWAKLLDGVFCLACLTFFRNNNRLPKRGE
jgi:hypothetical protein